MTSYLTAFQFRPQRAEPLVELARYFRERENHQLAYIYARRAVEIPQPDDRLFLDISVYKWRALDELSIAAYWVGRYRDSADACHALLNDRPLPELHRERVMSNLGFAEKQLQGQAA